MSVSISMVLFSDAASVPGDALLADLKKRWPQLTLPQTADESESTVTFSVGDALVAVAPMPGPIPGSELEGPAQTSMLWPDAKKSVESHQTHAIVTVMGGADELSSTQLLTKISASVMAVVPTSLGVFWGSAAMLVRKELFIELAEVDDHPLMLWVDFRVGPNETGGAKGFTHGLQALGHKEFETLDATEPPGEVRQRLIGLAGYVVENGPVIKDGDTIGENAQEKIKVEFCDSSFGHEGQVMQLHYSGSKQTKPSKPPAPEAVSLKMLFAILSIATIATYFFSGGDLLNTALVGGSSFAAVVYLLVFRLIQKSAKQ